MLMPRFNVYTTFCVSVWMLLTETLDVIVDIYVFYMKKEHLSLKWLYAISHQPSGNVHLLYQLCDLVCWYWMQIHRSHDMSWRVCIFFCIMMFFSLKKLYTKICIYLQYSLKEKKQNKRHDLESMLKLLCTHYLFDFLKATSIKWCIYNIDIAMHNRPWTIRFWSLVKQLLIFSVQFFLLL